MKYALVAIIGGILGIAGAAFYFIHETIGKI